MPLVGLLKDEIKRRFEQRDDSVSLVSHTLGYELRCARPGSYDLAYCRDLGHGGIRLLLDSQRDLPGGFMVTVQQGDLVPIPFDDMIDPHTRRTMIRQLDIASYTYQVARAYMIRLEREDFETPAKLEALATEAHCSAYHFRKKFERVTQQGAGAHNAHNLTRNAGVTISALEASLALPV
ncbi:MAG: hypothetical protein IIC25_01535 [Chloroflexi bacterium]|nr:hypothetical protein [Chloroflexota bacterium]